MWPANNPESWRKLREIVGEKPNDDYWSKWKQMVDHVLSELEARSLAESFRIGQSMHTIIFSTLEHHCLAKEARLTLDFEPEKKTVQIAYSHSCAHLSHANDHPHYYAPLAQESVLLSEAVPSVLSFLRRLWAETKPEIPTPDGLKDA
jgi:hypothetical protein